MRRCQTATRAAEQRSGKGGMPPQLTLAGIVTVFMVQVTWNWGARKEEERLRRERKRLGFSVNAAGPLVKYSEKTQADPQLAPK